jgi:hypothetical protein
MLYLANDTSRSAVFQSRRFIAHGSRDDTGD